MASRNQGSLIAQANYQPLQLENFAQPLAQMQANYDKTESAFEDADFSIDSLSADSERASELANKLSEDRDAVLEELRRTKNYRQAAKRLKKLNKVYNEDPEISGIRSQRAAILQDAEKQAERLKKGDITETQVKDRRDYINYLYAKQGGYGYDRENNTGSNIRIPILEKNLEEDIQTVLLKAAKDAPSITEAELQPLVDRFGISMEELKTKLKVKDGPKLAQELKQMFEQNENYQEYWKNRSEYDWFIQNRNNPNFKTDYLQEHLGKLNSYEQQVKNSDFSEKEKNNIYDGINNFKRSMDKAYQQGNLEEFVEHIYKNNYANDKLNSLSDAAADLFDFHERDMSTKNISGGSGSGSGADDVIEGGLTLNTQAVNHIDGNNYGIFGGGGSDTEIFKEQTLGDNRELVQRLEDAVKEKTFPEGTPKNIAVRERNKIVAQGIADNYKLHDKAIEDSKIKIEEKRNILKETDDNGQKNKLAAEIRELELGIKKQVYKKTTETAYLESEFEKAYNNGMLSDEMEKIYLAKGVRGLSEYVNSVEVKPLSEEKAAEFDNPDDFRATLKSKEGDILIYSDIIHNWRKQVGTSKTPTNKEIILDDNFGNLIGEDNLNTIKSFLTDFNNGDVAGIKVVNYNPSTAKVSNVRETADTKLDVSEYNMENASFAQIDTSEGNHRMIFRVARNSMTPEDIVTTAIGGGQTSDNFHDVITKYKAYKNTDGVELDSDTKVDRQVMRVLEWEKNNPQNAYIMFENKSVTSRLKDNADNSLISNLRMGVVREDYRSVNNSLEAYSTFALASNTDLKRDYNEMSVKLKLGWDNENSSEIVAQTAHTFKKDEVTGEEVGYIVEFHYDGGGENESLNQPVARVYRTTRDKFGIVDGGMEAVQTIPLSNVEATTIKKISTYYGVGNNAEKVYDRYGNSYVPAFQTGGIYREN